MLTCANIEDFRLSYHPYDRLGRVPALVTVVVGDIGDCAMDR